MVLEDFFESQFVFKLIGTGFERRLGITGMLSGGIRGIDGIVFLFVHVVVTPGATLARGDLEAKAERDERVELVVVLMNFGEGYDAKDALLYTTRSGV